MTSAHKTVIAVAALIAMAPATVYATGEVITVISDPTVPSAKARVSTDGRIGVRGEAGTYPVVPANTFRSLPQARASQQGTYPNRTGPTIWCCSRADEAIAVGQWTATLASGTLVSPITVTLRKRSASGTTCDNRLDPSNFDVVATTTLEPGVTSRQATFPIPLTLAPWRQGEGVCLVATQPSTSHSIIVEVNGVGGPVATPFQPPAPVKG